MRKSTLGHLQELKNKGENIGVFYNLYGRGGHFISGKILAVNTSFIQLESSHLIYFDPSTFCYVEKIIYKGKTIYSLKKKESKRKQPAK